MEKRFSLSVMGEKAAPPEVREEQLPDDASLEERVVAKIKTIFDPELPVNIWELGLIYNLKISPTNEVFIEMTLTSPNCPVAGSLVGEVQRKAASVTGVSSAKVELVWSPPWDKSRMSEAALLECGLL